MKKQKLSQIFWRDGVIIIAQSFLGFFAYADNNNEIPESFPPARYVQMAAKSPFALATPVAASTMQTPSFAANLFVEGIAKIGDADYVSIVSRDKSTTAPFSLIAGETGENEISLVSIEWSEQIGKSKVTIKKGSEFAVLEFDQAALMAQSAPQSPMQPPQPPTVPHLPQQPGDGRRIIFPNQQTGTTPVPGARQRIKIINNKP